jgi:hypothetical protein
MKKLLILVALVSYTAQAKAEEIYSRWYCSAGKIAQLEYERDTGQWFLQLDDIRYPVTQFEQTNYGANILARRNMDEAVMMDAFNIKGPLSGKMNYSGGRKDEYGFTGQCTPDRYSQTLGKR